MFDDSSSQSSGRYSNLNYCSGDEYDPQISPRNPKMHAQNPSRFCPGESSSCLNQNRDIFFSGGVPTSFSKEKCVRDMRRLTRNRSLVDMRSQLLHRSLVEEVSKRRLFKTVGAVENIGFQDPYEVSRKTSRLVKNVWSSCKKK